MFFQPCLLILRGALLVPEQRSPAVGLAINREGREAYFQPLAPCTGDFIMAGAWLYTDFEDQHPVLPAIPGLGHCLVRGRSLSQLLQRGQQQHFGHLDADQCNKRRKINAGYRWKQTATGSQKWFCYAVKY